MNLPIIIKVFIFMGVVLVYGCGATTLHKNYGYLPVEKDLGWGVLHAKLRGKPVSKGDEVTVTGAPYELLVWFTTDDTASIQGCEILIYNLSLRPVAIQKKIRVGSSVTSQFKLKKNGVNIASFLFKNIELKFVDYKLVMYYRIIGDSPSLPQEQSIELLFKVDYQEKEITFWDSLMGI